MILLPILSRAPQGAFAELATASRPVLDGLKSLTPGKQESGHCEVPTLDTGEQFRFHFDMTRCIGCRCCEVACNEQNNNPAHVTWRRVGEVETGEYPQTRRFHLSMACNHCLEPPCLEGCPTDAYTKLDNGIVHHDAETCIGCQYCTWTCPYGAPQFHPERHVVTKCSLCAERLAEGQLPACVQACPTTAIEVEKVDVAAWRAEVLAEEAPASAYGLPDPRLTLSTTRYTLPVEGPRPRTIEAFEDVRELRPEAPHWPLVWLLVLTQASVGAFGASLALWLAGSSHHWVTSILGWLLCQGGLAASTFHLGRPVFALRATRAWRHSWLSREAIAFGAFGALSTATTAVAAFDLLGAVAMSTLYTVLYTVTILLGLFGITTSAMIYLLPARPAWNTWRTPTQFFTTAALLGSSAGLSVALLLGDSSSRLLPVFASTSFALALLQAALPWNFVLAAAGAATPALRSSALLLAEGFPRIVRARTAVLLACAFAFLAVGVLRVAPAGVAAIACIVACGAEVAGRYLFFVTVVPLDMPGHFFTRKGAH